MARYKEEPYKSLEQKLNGMLNRCNSDSNNAFQKCYRDRGIKVCEEWQGGEGLERFIEWSLRNGYSSERNVIDRIDTFGDYSPENCRYVTHKENCRNKENCLYFFWKGKARNLSEICEMEWKNYGTVASRLRAGKSIHDAIYLPVKKYAKPVKRKHVYHFESYQNITRNRTQVQGQMSYSEALDTWKSVLS